MRLKAGRIWAGGQWAGRHRRIPPFLPIVPLLARVTTQIGCQVRIRVLILNSIFRKKPAARAGLWVAGVRGFEPRLTVPETVVLPLDHTPMVLATCAIAVYHQQCHCARAKNRRAGHCSKTIVLTIAHDAQSQSWPCVRVSAKVMAHLVRGGQRG